MRPIARRSWSEARSSTKDRARHWLRTANCWRPIWAWPANRRRAARRCSDRESRGTSHAQNQAALPRRSRQQPAAFRAAQTGPRQTRARRDFRRRAVRDRGSRDREHRPQAGADRVEARDRRRIPPVVVAFRFPRKARRRRGLRARARHSVSRGRDQAQGRARRRQDRIFRSSHARALPVPESAYARPTEDDDSEPERAALPQRPERHQQEDLPRYRAILRRSRRDLSQGGARVRGRRLPLSSARRYRVGLSVLRPAARGGASARRRSAKSAGELCPCHQSGDRRQAERHGDHHPFVPGQFPLDLDRGGRVRAGRRNAAGSGELRRLFSRIRHRAGRRLRAAALPAEGQQDRGARPRDLEDRHARAEGRRKADTRWPACAGHDRLRMITTATTHPHHEPDEIAAIRQAVRALCEKFPGEYWRALDRERAYPTEFVEALTQAGFLAALIPEQYGGSGLTMSAAIAIMEEIQANGCNGAACHAQMYVMGTLLRHGSPEQKQKFLPSIARGELRLQAFGVTEPTSGTDTLNLRTTA